MNNQLNRRSFFGLSVAATAAAALAACAPNAPAARKTNRIMPGDPSIARYESRRASTGATVRQKLSPGAFTTTLAGKSITTWGYNGSLAAPVIRGKVGDQLDATVVNGLKDGTSIHWHGLALRNNDDGVPNVTQQAIAAGASYNYSFKLPHPGTYWYHSHVEMQRERALYGALIIEDPNEPLSYDKDWVIVLDDWIDGLDGTPGDVLKGLSRGMTGMAGMSGMGQSSSPPSSAMASMSGMDMGSGAPMSSASPSAGGMSGGYMLMGARSDFLGGDAGDVKYPVHLFNGKTPERPETFDAKPGERVRLRIINAAGDTAYRVGVPGQKITLTHTDGFPVVHKEVDAVVLGMGERIDALLTVRDGYTPVLALAEGKGQRSYGLVSTGTGTAPAMAGLPARLEGTVVDSGQLTADPAVVLPSKTPDRVHALHLTGGMGMYDWGINGHRFDMTTPFANAFEVKIGERVEVKFINDTDMWHPMHIHGHTFQVGESGARKDTVIVRPKQSVTVRFDADNPGQWLTHCHNAYHAERGMMGVFSYTT
ncbi:multicopper oxidase family protein [Paenarthrobacter sp. Z7-10]|uniref:multicopper oxidase family protein n=1 Tax=Paenarthrobacter sp. Z7-10 TaxID=2787635 RepID=UPI0022A9E4C8|nr:multicopper oxidase family protein [Paenarthrobacter sp. Z7-10]MCZ2403898.1 multicopper oxidase family protein [Paenarthrobacter sp. Z7-10]